MQGQSPDLRLDAVEGLYTIVNSSDAFEIRIERVRAEVAQRFKIRIKNIAEPGAFQI